MRKAWIIIAALVVAAAGVVIFSLRQKPAAPAQPAAVHQPIKANVPAVETQNQPFGPTDIPLEQQESPN